MKLILKLIAGILIGSLTGLFAPEVLTRLLLTFKSLFGELLFFVIPLLILFFITSGIAALPKKSGKLLGRTLGVAYLSTAIAGIGAFFVARLVVRLLTANSQTVAEELNGNGLLPVITMDIPPISSVMAAFVLAFVLELGISATGATALTSASDEGRDIIENLLVNLHIALLPVFIAGVVAEMAAAGTVFDTVKTFRVILILAVVLHWV